MTQELECRWLPGMRPKDHGWLVIDEETWFIKNWHHFKDFGQSIETVTATRDGEEIEVYSLDEGLTWVDDL